MLINKENLMRIEFTRKIAGIHSIEMVALYNQKKISENEVQKVIEANEYHPHVIIVEKKQFENVFIA